MLKWGEFGKLLIRSLIAFRASKIRPINLAASGSKIAATLAVCQTEDGRSLTDFSSRISLILDERPVTNRKLYSHAPWLVWNARAR